IPPDWRREATTTARPARAPTTTRTTTAPSSWIQTATTLKPSATGRHSAAQPPRHHTTSTQPPSPFKSCADPPRCCRPQREHRQRYLGAVPGRWHRPSPCRRHRSPGPGRTLSDSVLGQTLPAVLRVVSSQMSFLLVGRGRSSHAELSNHWRDGALVALPECLLFLDSVLLPGVGLVGETREAEQRLLLAAEDAPVPVLLVGGLPVLGNIEPDVDVARGQDEWPGDAVAPGDDWPHLGGLEVEDVVLEVGPAQVGVDVFEFLHATEVLGRVPGGDDAQVVTHDELMGQDWPGLHCGLGGGRLGGRGAGGRAGLAHGVPPCGGVAG